MLQENILMPLELQEYEIILVNHTASEERVWVSWEGEGKVSTNGWRSN